MKFHLADRQLEAPAAACECCGGALYGWETVYIIDEEVICEDCIGDYAKERFRPQRWVLEDWNQRRDL